MKTSLFLLSLLSFACNSEIASVITAETAAPIIAEESSKDQRWEGAFTNGT